MTTHFDLSLSVPGVGVSLRRQRGKYTTYDRVSDSNLSLELGATGGEDAVAKLPTEISFGYMVRFLSLEPSLSNQLASDRIRLDQSDQSAQPVF